MLLTLRRFLFNRWGDLLPSSCFAWRRFILRLMGVKVKKSARVNAGFRIYGSGPMSIDDEAWIGRNCHFYTIGDAGVDVGAKTEIGPECIFNCQSHKTGKDDHRAGDCVRHSIKIGSGVWMGTRCTILCGKIGDGSVIGAGAVVLDDVAGNVLAAGVPAKEKKWYF
ncbi:MAG: acyltransferase [Treponema sp.]|nr:acyltransferase [Treponema sp.]